MATLSRFVALTMALHPTLLPAQHVRARRAIARVGAILVTPDAAPALWVSPIDCDGDGAPGAATVTLAHLEVASNQWHRARDVRGQCVPPLRRPTLDGMRLRCFGALRAEAFIGMALQRACGSTVRRFGETPTHVVVGEGMTGCPADLAVYRESTQTLVLSEAELLELIEIAVTPLPPDAIQVAYLQSLAFARMPKLAYHVGI